MSITTSDLYDAHAAEVTRLRCPVSQFRADRQLRRAVLHGEDLRGLPDAQRGLGAAWRWKNPGCRRRRIIALCPARRPNGQLAIRNGWAGAIIFGAVRDSQALASLDFGVKALGTTARRALPDVSGLRDIPITIGGATFHPGDWVYADADAVLVAGRRLHGPDI